MPGPSCQVTMNWIRPGELDILVIFKRQVNVLKRWRNFDSLVNAKAHSHRLIFVNVRILPENHHFNIAEFRLLIGIEYLMPWRVAWIVWQIVLFFHEIEKLFKFVSWGHVSQWLFPVPKGLDKGFDRFQTIFVGTKRIFQNCSILTWLFLNDKSLKSAQIFDQNKDLPLLLFLYLLIFSKIA